MNNLIWTPILKLFLIGCLDREWRCLHRQIRLPRFLWFNFKTSVLSLMLCLFLNMVRINDLMFLLNIERFKFMTITYSFYCIISSMFSLVLSMNTLWIMIPDMLIDHLSSSRSSHEMFIILNKIDRSFFWWSIKSVSDRLFSVIIVFSVLNNLLILLISNRSRWT